MKKVTKFNRIKSIGFSLIELLVVISIIGALAALSVVSYSAVQKQARDTQRKNDLKHYQSLLIQFASENRGFYPSSSGGVVNLDVMCSSVLLNTYTSSCPTDPGSGARAYSYMPNVSGVAGYPPTSTRYTLYIHGGLEAETDKTFVICSNGFSGIVNNTWSVVSTICSP